MNREDCFKQAVYVIDVETGTATITLHTEINKPLFLIMLDWWEEAHDYNRMVNDSYMLSVPYFHSVYPNEMKLNGKYAEWKFYSTRTPLHFNVSDLIRLGS